MRCLTNFITLTLTLWCTGCTSVHISQTDESQPQTQTRKVTTSVKARAIFAGSQTLEKLKATQTDKTQGVGIDAVAQQQPTNSLELVVRLLELLR